MPNVRIKFMKPGKICELMNDHTDDQKNCVTCDALSYVFRQINENILGDFNAAFTCLLKSNRQSS